ncbi:MAG: M50 family metallopeptidase [Chitinophagales bacterium]
MELKINPLFLGLCLLSLLVDPRNTLLILLALILHELAHLTAGWLTGLGLTRLEFFPFGAQIMINDLTGDRPVSEVITALAGPLVSLFLSGLIYIMKGNLEWTGFSFFVQFNLLLGAFNLLPALPLDGGRVLRSLLSLQFGIRNATRIASVSGTILAFVLLGTGFYYSIHDWHAVSIVACALFLGIKAREERILSPYIFTRYLLRKRTLANPVRAVVWITGTDIPVKRLMAKVRPQTCLIILVQDKMGQPLMLVTEAALIDCYLEKGPNIKIGDLINS